MASKLNLQRLEAESIHILREVVAEAERPVRDPAAGDERRLREGARTVRKRPIGRFQGLKHQLADAPVDVEPARGLYWYSAYAYDRSAPDASRLAALAKAHLGEVFMRMARTAIEAHGGVSYTWEYDAQIWYKRALFDFSYLGAAPVAASRAGGATCAVGGVTPSASLLRAKVIFGFRQPTYMTYLINLSAEAGGRKP